MSISFIPQKTENGKIIEEKFIDKEIIKEVEKFIPVERVIEKTIPQIIEKETIREIPSKTLEEFISKISIFLKDFQRNDKILIDISNRLKTSNDLDIQLQNTQSNLNHIVYEVNQNLKKLDKPIINIKDYSDEFIKLSKELELLSKNDLKQKDNYLEYINLLTNILNKIQNIENINLKKSIDTYPNYENHFRDLFNHIDFKFRELQKDKEVLLLIKNEIINYSKNNISTFENKIEYTNKNINIFKNELISYLAEIKTNISLKYNEVFTDFIKILDKKLSDMIGIEINNLINSLGLEEKLIPKLFFEKEFKTLTNQISNVELNDVKLLNEFNKVYTFIKTNTEIMFKKLDEINFYIQEQKKEKPIIKLKESSNGLLEELIIVKKYKNLPPPEEYLNKKAIVQESYFFKRKGIYFSLGTSWIRI